MQSYKKYLELAINFIVAGLIGGFIIDYYARPSFDIAIYNKHEAIAAIAGVLMWVYILVL